MANPTHLKRLRPVHLRMIELFWQGQTEIEIAVMLSYTPQQVGNVLRSEEALAILQQLQDSTLDSMTEVSVEIQLAAPIAAEKLVSQLNSVNEHIAHKAAVNILDRAGHMPVKRVQLTRDSAIDKKYSNKTEEEIRAEIAMELGISGGAVGGGNGPDGRPLN